MAAGRSRIPGGPALTVHRDDDDTFIIRESLCTSFAAPFIYLLFAETAS